MMRDIQRRVEWILVSGRWTRVSVMGTNLSEESLRKDNMGENDNRIVILMVPGNPGNEGFYADFGKRVLSCLLSREERLGKRKLQFLFYTVSHLNHVVLPTELHHSGKHRCDERFTLDEQVQHKLDFVKEFLPRGHRVYMLGHSIGSYMLLRILPYIKEDFNLKKAVCLYPTIEKMAETPNGIRLRKVLATLNANDWLAKSLTFWLDFLPSTAKKWLVSWNLTGEGVPADVISSASELLNMNVFRNIVHMSNDELDQVTELDETLLFHKESIFFYYGIRDGWCPLELGEKMSARMARGHVIVDTHNCEHAFVIRDGKVMAEEMLQFIV
ncbi:unnamed protein product [Caenorhabditis auriculariae]|uniref:Lipid droplet-associated hydrolase n=1 Tax=Caenorhabditis auriculariae TaxID=2777116 RepID=A0A8S1H0I0_9PELO|nr:unnamed protein product [Caenorhabditis auriculariae]